MDNLNLNLESKKFFCLDEDKELDFYRVKMMERQSRGFGYPLFSVGDILNVSYISKFITYGFSGICISLKKKKLKNANVSIILRNILNGVGVELTISYFYNRAYRITISDHSRKEFYYRRAKLYYIRTRVNRESRIK